MRLPGIDGPEPTVNVPETCTTAALLMLNKLSEPATPTTRLVVFQSELVPVTMTVLPLAVVLLPMMPVTLSTSPPAAMVNWLLAALTPTIRSPPFNHAAPGPETTTALLLAPEFSPMCPEPPSATT